MLATSRSGRTGPAEKRTVSARETLQFLGVLWALDQELRTLSKRMEVQLGVTGPQRLALRLIGAWPSLPASALAAGLHLHPSTVTGLILRLVRKGLVRRQPDPRDGRRVLLVLTPRGVRINRQRRGTVEAAVSRLLLEVPSGRLAITRDVLGRLRESVGRELAARLDS